MHRCVTPDIYIPLNVIYKQVHIWNTHARTHTHTHTITMCTHMVSSSYNDVSTCLKIVQVDLLQQARVGGKKSGTPQRIVLKGRRVRSTLRNPF